MLWGRLTLAGLALTFSGLVCADLQTGLQLEHDGRVRSYDLFIPAQADGNPRPLVLDLHGFTSYPSQQRNFSGLAEIASQNNFFAAWPAGFVANWNSVIGEDGIDDVGFLRALVAQISSQYAIDPARVYVTGFSQGGAMASRLACEADDLFAAFASVAGSIVRGSENGCSPARPLHMLAWRGENDDVVPYHGGVVELPGQQINVLSAQEVFDFWRGKNDCSSTADRENLGGDSFCDEARDCGQGTRTRACTVQGSGSETHVIYNNTAGLGLSQEIWDFFAPITHPDPSVGSFTINAGLNDAWYNRATAGQGFLITVFPGIRQMFVAWFTFDTERPPGNVEAVLGEPGHRWFTAQGPYTADTASLTIYVTEGGVFDAANPPASNDGIADGTMTIEFADCTEGLVSYEINSPNVSGEIPIQRITNDNVALCESLSSQ